MQFLKENNGQYSSSRVIFTFGMFWAMITSVVMAIVMEWGAGEFIAVFSAQTAPFVGLKLGQKPMEEKINKSNKDVA